MTVLERIESLRSKGKSPDEIERLLLNGKLGRIYPDKDGYQLVKDIQLSWLVVEAHNSGFIKWMTKHPYKYVVHHIDGNILNNIYSNLRVMKWGDHIRMHQTAYHADPKNAEAVRTKGRKVSKARIAYYSDPANAKDVEAANRKRSKTKCENRNWLTTDSSPVFFEKWFSVKEYAEASEICTDTAYYRLTVLLTEGQIICKNKLVNGKWSNVYTGAKE